MAKEILDTHENSICSMVRKAENNYITGSTTISKYVDWSMYENVEKIDAYLNSKHISGDEDSLGREKPFFDIVSSAVNIWYRATDIDRKNIRIRPSKSSDDLIALLATVHLHDWMKRERFGSFLNDWGRSLAKYGSSIVKFVNKDGKLIPSVMAWNRMIVDPVDFDNNLKIEILELTEAQLYQMPGYDKEVVEKLCDTKKARETMGRQNIDNRSDYIKLYEVHGNLPLSLLTNLEEDEDTYVDQMHVISFVAGKDKGQFDDFTLIKGREAKSPYMITHLIKEDGRTMGIGAVEHLFEAQWMMNHTVKSIKDQLDLASKLIFQTSDGNFVGQNALSAIESGDILIHAVNEPLTQLANSSHDITSLQNFSTMWKGLGQEITSTPDAMMGNTAPSGTAWRQVEALQAEAHSLFELMTENKGLAIEDMMTTFVIPYIKTKMDTSKEIVGTLEQYDLKKIDSRYVSKKATELTNEKIVDMIINDENPTPEDQALLNQVATQGIQAALAEQGNTRYFVPSEVDDMTWKEIIKDLEWTVDVDVTGESKDTQNILATLSTVLSTIAGLGGQPMSDQMKLVFNKILELTGALSPVEMQEAQSSKDLPTPDVTNQLPTQAPAPTTAPTGVPAS